MRRTRNLLGFLAFSLLVLGLPTIASAQWNGGNNGTWGNNRNGGYGNYDSRALRSTVKDLKNSSRDFQKRLSREIKDNDRYDRGRYGNNNSNYLNDLAKQFKDAADNLENNYKNDRDYNRSSDEARRVLDLGNQLDSELYRSRAGNNLQSDWNNIRRELDIIANAYGYNNRRGNRNRNGNWRNNIPFPLPF